MDKYEYGLKNTTEVGVALLDAIMKIENLSETAKLNLAKKLIRPLKYGKDGYYFVYENGTGFNLIHGDKQELEGQNLWDLQDPDESQFIIRTLDRVAKEGLLFHEYHWTKPKEDGLFPKLGTAMMIPGQDIWIGTGEYIDDINVKGIEYPVQTYEVVDFKENIKKEERLIRENIDGFKVNADLGLVNKKNKIQILKALKKAFDTVKGI